MSDQIEIEENNEPVKAKRPPKRAKIGAKKAGSRIGYKDRNKMTVEGRDPNYVYRIVNVDNEKYSGRLEEMQKIGYKIVNDDSNIGDDQGVEASSIGSNVGKHVGHGTRGVLMRIDRKYYEEDKAAKQAEVDQTERGMIDKELHDGQGLYGDGLK